MAIIKRDGLDAVSRSCGEKHSLLSLSAMYNWPQAVQMLLSHGVNVDACDKDGGVPLHSASHNDSVGCTELLVKARASCNAKSKDGCTPLHKGLKKLAGAETVELLLSFNADPRLTDNQGFTPLHWAVAQNRTGSKQISHAAALETKKIMKLLIDRGNPPDAPGLQCEGTPLMWLLKYPEIYSSLDDVRELAMYLVSRGADPLKEDGRLVAEMEEGEHTMGCTANALAHHVLGKELVPTPAYPLALTQAPAPALLALPAPAGSSADVTDAVDGAAPAVLALPAPAGSSADVTDAVDGAAPAVLALPAPAGSSADVTTAVRPARRLRSVKVDEDGDKVDEEGEKPQKRVRHHVGGSLALLSADGGSVDIRLSGAVAAQLWRQLQPPPPSALLLSKDWDQQVCAKSGGLYVVENEKLRTYLEALRRKHCEHRVVVCGHKPKVIQQNIEAFLSKGHKNAVRPDVVAMLVETDDPRESLRGQAKVVYRAAAPGATIQKHEVIGILTGRLMLDSDGYDDATPLTIVVRKRLYTCAFTVCEENKELKQLLEDVGKGADDALIIDPFPDYGNLTMVINDKKDVASKANCMFVEFLHFGQPTVCIVSTADIKRPQHHVSFFDTQYRKTIQVLTSVGKRF
jgi:hypothetical protein